MTEQQLINCKYWILEQLNEIFQICDQPDDYPIEDFEYFKSLEPILEDLFRPDEIDYIKSLFSRFETIKEQLKQIRYGVMLSGL